HSLKIQRHHVRTSLRCIDCLGCALRLQDAIMHHKYISGSILHINGHHKLMLWGFVIHGMINDHDHVVS
ncbi:hypothetical protein JB92DRAFT_2555522, partial [Gautieria morchelliformis]